MDSAKLHSILTRVQKPARYLGNEVNAVHKDFDAAAVRICLVFPDAYEIGMSHVGLKILYDILNRLPDVICERSFAPAIDLEAELRKEKLPLFSLESKRPLSDFDIVGFSLTYELTYTNMVNILDLSGIPVWQKDRGPGDPLVIAGGGCTMNAEPVADFLDAAAIGDGEELILDVVNAVRRWKKGEPRVSLRGRNDRSNPAGSSGSPRPFGARDDRTRLLELLAEIEGIYIPSFFRPQYNDDGTLARVVPLKAGYERINKRIVSNIDSAPYPTNLIVPNVKPVHDRIGIEIQRGCNRACRFCQAGYIDRPVRQRSPGSILRIADESLRNTGIGEISLLSLSAADYDCLVPLLAEINRRYDGENVSLSVPATRTEKLTPDLIEQIKKVRKTGFTIAPEAGTAKMRRVINKGNKVDDLFRAVENAFSAGWSLLKLYYMVGLPFEEDSDLEGIADEGNASIEICLRHTRRAELNLSLSSFVPKPHTPFQWEPQIGIEETKRRYGHVRTRLKNRRIHLKHHHPEMSFVEGLLSRGDRRVSELLFLAVAEGARFDEWEEHFSFSKWERAMAQWGIDPAFYLSRKRSRDEILPWDHLFAQMDKGFLWEELERAHDVALEGDRSQEPGVRSQEPGVRSQETGVRRKGPQSRPDQLAGFTEDCSVARCSDCGVCDFRQVKNRIYVKGDEGIVEKRGHREWYGWGGRGQQETGDRSQEAEVESQKAEEQQNSRLRVRFSKTGDARFLGHLELMDVLKRAFKRLKIPVAWSQGFHPQIRLSMGPPLPLGLESQWEYFDLVLTAAVEPEEFRLQLNDALPMGISLLSAESVDRETPSLYSSTASILYRATFWTDSCRWPETAREKIVSFSESEKDFWCTRQKPQRGPLGGGKEIKSYNLTGTVDFNLAEFPEALVFETKTRSEGTAGPREILSAVVGLSPEELGTVRLQKIGMTLVSIPS